MLLISECIAFLISDEIKSISMITFMIHEFDNL